MSVRYSSCYNEKKGKSEIYRMQRGNVPAGISGWDIFLHKKTPWTYALFQGGVTVGKVAGGTTTWKDFYL